MKNDEEKNSSKQKERKNYFKTKDREHKYIKKEILQIEKKNL